MCPKEKQDWLPTQIRQRGWPWTEPLPGFELRRQLAVDRQEKQICSDPYTDGTRMEFRKLPVHQADSPGVSPLFFDGLCKHFDCGSECGRQVRLFSNFELRCLGRYQPLRIPCNRHRILNSPRIQSCAASHESASKASGVGPLFV